MRREINIKLKSKTVNAENTTERRHGK